MSLDGLSYRSEAGVSPVRGRYALRLNIPERFEFDSEISRSGKDVAEVAASSIDSLISELDTEDFLLAEERDRRFITRRIRAYILDSVSYLDSQDFIKDLKLDDVRKVFNACKKIGLLNNSNVFKVLSSLHVSLLTKDIDPKNYKVASEIGVGLRNASDTTKVERRFAQSRRSRSSKRRKTIKVPSAYDAKKIRKLSTSLKNAANLLSTDAFEAASYEEQDRIEDDLRKFFIGMFQRETNRDLLLECKPTQAVSIYKACLEVGVSEHPLISPLMLGLVKSVIRKRNVAKPGVVSQMLNLSIRRKLNAEMLGSTYVVSDQLVKISSRQAFDLDKRSRVVLLETMSLLGRKSPALAEKIVSSAISEMKHRDADFRSFYDLHKAVYGHGLSSSKIRDLIIRELKSSSPDFHPVPFKKFVRFVAKSGEPVPHPIFSNYVPRLERVRTASSAVSLICVAVTENYAEKDFLLPLIQIVEKGLNTLNIKELSRFVRALGDIGYLGTDLASRIVEKSLEKQRSKSERHKHLGPFTDIMLGLEYAALREDRKCNIFPAKSFRKSLEKVWKYISTDTLKCTPNTGVLLAQLSKATGKKLPDSYDRAAQIGFTMLNETSVSKFESDVGKKLKALVGAGVIRNLEHHYKNLEQTAGIELEWVFEHGGIKIFSACDGVPHHYLNRSLASSRKGRDLMIEKIAESAGFVSMPINSNEWSGVNGSRFKYLSRRIRKVRDEQLGRNSKSTYAQTTGVS